MSNTVKKVPTRRCVGCMESKPKAEMIRVTYTVEDGLVCDELGKAPGRGVYVCQDSECIRKAGQKNAFNRALKIKISKGETEKLIAELEKYEKKN